jgi:hypothetical protein
MWTEDRVYVPWRESAASVVSPMRSDETRPGSVGGETLFTPHGSVVGAPSGVVGAVELPAFSDR